MINLIRRKSAQSTLEYAILIVVVIAALLSLQVYIKRGLQGKMRSSADDIGDQFAVGDGANFTKTVTSHSSTDETVIAGVTSTNVDQARGGKWTTTNETVTLPGMKSDDVFKGDVYDPAAIPTQPSTSTDPGPTQPTS
jgi:hypothetical protein